MVTIAPVWSQVVQALWADVRHLWAVSKLPQVFPSWQILHSELQTHPLTPKWRAYGLASNDSANIEGRHPAAGQPTLAVVDESFNVADPFFDSLQGMLSEGDSKLVAIGRAGIPHGWFYRAFSTERQLWGYVKKVRADEIPRLWEKCESERKRLGEDSPSFKQQWLAEFTGADDGSVIPLAYVERAIGRAIPAVATWRKVVALDIAGSGGDENVLTFRHGPVIIKQVGWEGWDEMQTAYRAVKEAGEFGAEAVIYDEIGIGAGVGSRIRELLKASKISVHGFNAGRSARDKEQYVNIKAEEIFALRQRFLDGEISIPNRADLIGQLCGWRTEFTPSGKTKIVDPDDSPDYADSALMAFAADRIGHSIQGVTPAFLQ